MGVVGVCRACGMVGLRSRATGVAGPETSLCSWTLYPGSPLFGFYRRATPDRAGARPHADTPIRRHADTFLLDAVSVANQGAVMV